MIKYWVEWVEHGDSSHLMLVELDELRTELLYNLGINVMLNHMSEKEKENV